MIKLLSSLARMSIVCMERSTYIFYINFPDRVMCLKRVLKLSRKKIKLIFDVHGLILYVHCLYGKEYTYLYFINCPNRVTCHVCPGPAAHQPRTRRRGAPGQEMMSHVDTVSGSGPLIGHISSTEHSDWPVLASNVPPYPPW